MPFEPVHPFIFLERRSKDYLGKWGLNSYPYHRGGVNNVSKILETGADSSRESRSGTIFDNLKFELLTELIFIIY